MRSNLEDNQSFNQSIKSGKFSLSRKVMVGNDQITLNGSLVNFYDPNGAQRIATLPALEAGRFFMVANVGVTYNVVVKDASAATVATVAPGELVLLTCSGTEWRGLRGSAAMDVFTNTTNGLVPAPNSAVPGSLFLRDDGQWGQVQVVGVVDAFKYITDGTTIAIGSGPDTFRLRSSSGKVGIIVTNNEAVFGDNANFTVNEAAIDHNALLNYVADQHVAHSTVTLTAGNGLSGGGTIAASRTFDLDLNDLTTDTPVLADTFGFYDVSGFDTNKATFTVLNGILDHNALLNYVADRHIAHSGVSIVAGVGLTGGGDITTSRTLALDINGLTADTLATGDFFVFYDISQSDHNKITFGNLNGTLDHNALLNYVANQHIDHTTVSITAGTGLSGGGTIAATRTINVATNGITGSLFRQSVARSVVGVTGNVTADVADIQGATDQVLRVNSAGTALAFGAIDLSKAAAATGILQAASFPVLTGDVTTAGGALAATIANDAVTNAKLANMATMTVKSNITGGSADPVDNSLSAIIDAAIGSTRGMMLYRGASAWTALAIGANTRVLASNGTDPVWSSSAGGEPFALHAGIGGL